MTAASEPFPLLNTATEQLHHEANVAAARRRRKSSALGSDLRVGDTGAPGLATSLAHLGGGPDGHHSKEKRHSKRRKARSLARRVKTFALKHTWVIPLALLLVFLSLYALNPTDTNPVHHFIFLSYRLPQPPGGDGAPAQYAKGPWDVALVTFYIVVLSFTREFVMQELLRPLARFAGLRSRGKQARFMEQMYTALYFGILGPAGMYVMSRTPVWYFDTRGMYEGSPHKTHEAEFKFYYLFQAAYWAQQVIVLLLGMEKPRKDFRELIGHHIVSLSLIGLSYRFHFTYIGLAVYITHDISDFFLATSKSLNYIDGPFMGPYFALFVVVWVYLRHYLNLRIIWSLFTEYRTIGPYEIDWAAEQYKSPLSQAVTVFLLCSLQSLNLFWLYYILRIAVRFVSAGQASDDRSEGEEEDDDDDEEDEERETAEEKRAAVPQQQQQQQQNPEVVVTGVEQQEGRKKQGVQQRTANGSAKANGKVKK